MKKDRPVRVVTEEELRVIWDAFAYGSASPHRWAEKRITELKNFIDSGGIIEIPFTFGTLPPMTLTNLATFLNWRNEVWGRYYISS